MQEEQQELVASNVQHQAEKAKLEEATLPLMLEVMWAANVLDIQSTLRHVARVVGPDPELQSSQCPGWQPWSDISMSFWAA